MTSTPSPAPLSSVFNTRSGVEKAAIVLLILGEERAGQLMESMDQNEQITVTRALSSVGKVPPSLVREACEIFQSKLSEGEIMVGSAHTAKRMLEKFLPEDRVMSIMDEIKAPIGRTTWEKLTSINHVTLANYLVGEGEQTAAVVISRLRSDYAAKVFEVLPESFTVKLINRMIDLESVPRETIVEIENILQAEFMTTFGHGGIGSDPTGFLAEIFNRTSSDFTDKVLEEVATERPEDVQAIQSRMFTFNDLATIDTTAASAIMSNVPREVIILALKSAPENVVERFLSSVAERTSSIMRDEMQFLGPIRLREIKGAQDEVLRTAKRLEAAGEIVLKDSDDDRIID